MTIMEQAKAFEKRIDRGTFPEEQLKILDFLTHYTPNDTMSFIHAGFKGNDASVSRLVMNIYGFLASVLMDPEFEDKPNQFNTIICGESGSGKTTLFRALQMLPVPVIYADCGLLCSEGFRGMNASNLMDPWQALNYPVGICWLDEIDKMVTPRFSDKGNVSEEIQNNLLSIVEGNRHVHLQSGETVSSGRILFIGSGAFEGVEKKVDHRSGGIGFCSSLKEETERGDVDRKGLMAYGFTRQLCDRFSLIINLEKPDEAVFRSIIYDTFDEMEDTYGLSVKSKESIADDILSSCEGTSCRTYKQSAMDMYMSEVMMKFFECHRECRRDVTGTRSR